jgi:hypothetical protein
MLTPALNAKPWGEIRSLIAPKRFPQKPTHPLSRLLYKAEQAIHLSTLPVLSSNERGIVDALHQEGVCVTSLDALGIPGSDRLLDAAHQVMATMPSILSPDPLNDWHIGNHAVQVNSVQLASNYPDIYLWGLQQRLLTIVTQYIRQPVSYLSVNLRRDMANALQVGTRLWHRDIEDYRMLKVIIYLNDVGAEGGPFEYIPRSLTPGYESFPNTAKILNQDMVRAVPESAWKSCTGAAGTIVLVDTASVFHHGSVPESERYALFFTYTSRRPHWIEPYKGNFAKGNAKILTQDLSRQQKQYLLWKA